MDEIKQNLKKIMDKSKLNDMIQESTLDLKVNLKDMTSFSLAYDIKNLDYINGIFIIGFSQLYKFLKKTLNCLQRKEEMD